VPDVTGHGDRPGAGVCGDRRGEVGTGVQVRVGPRRGYDRAVGPEHAQRRVQHGVGERGQRRRVAPGQHQVAEAPVVLVEPAQLVGVRRG
jgi:hypothetical protein